MIKNVHPHCRRPEPNTGHKWRAPKARDAPEAQRSLAETTSIGGFQGKRRSIFSYGVFFIAKVPNRQVYFVAPYVLM